MNGGRDGEEGLAETAPKRQVWLGVVGPGGRGSGATAGCEPPGGPANPSGLDDEGVVELSQLAEAVGTEVALAGAVLVCGGLGGCMEAACRGAKSAGGLTVGILPGRSRSEANPWVDVSVPSGMGEMRNALVVRASDAVIAVGGGYGTLYEVALALKEGVPVVGLETWHLSRSDGADDTGIVRVEGAREAVVEALRRVRPGVPADGFC